MKIDYDLLKTVLTTLDEDEKFEMRTNDLRNKIGKNITDDQFIGHLLELNDNGCFAVSYTHLTLPTNSRV